MLSRELPLRAIVSTRGRVVIPAKLRHKYGITAGSRVTIFEENGRVIVKPIKSKATKAR